VRRVAATALVFGGILGGIAVAACATDSTPSAFVQSTPGGSAAASSGPGVFRYVALGDSYTIGTATRRADERWPDQLLARLGPGPSTLQLVANLGVNGYTSREVIEAELPKLDALRPEFISLLIGVNDVVQGVPEARYRQNVEEILSDLIARLPPNRIVAIATPDYTVTPQGGAYGDPAEQAAGILRNNAILRDLATAKGITFVDIHDLSLRAASDASLVADDGLHPSGAQYRLWVDRIAPAVAELLGS
jgi:acyl-CoA thioesterase-1